MEWLAKFDTGDVSVVVPDELVPTVLEAVRPIALAVDPYRDRTLSADGAARVAEALRKVLEDRRSLLETETLKRLGLRETTPWSVRAINASLRADTTLRVFQNLEGICRRAAAERRHVDILGD